MATPAGSTVRAGDLDVGLVDGGGDGVPLVLVHGGESDRTQFTTIRARLGAGIRAISYDQRDSGIGGAIAQHLVLRHPERVASLILVATTPSFAMTGAVIDELLTLSHEDRVKAGPDYFFTPQGQAEQRIRPTRTLTARTPEQSARRHDVARQHEVRDRFGKITAPTLIVHGTDDRLTTHAGEIARWVREFLGVDAA